MDVVVASANDFTGSVPTGVKQVPLKIGALNLKRWQADDLLSLVQSQSNQCYVLCPEDHNRVSWVGGLGGVEVFGSTLSSTFISVHL